VFRADQVEEVWMRPERKGERVKVKGDLWRSVCCVLRQVERCGVK